jgi:hypothetical protein
MSIMLEDLLGSALSGFCGEERMQVIPRTWAEAVPLPSSDNSAGARSSARAGRVVQATVAVFAGEADLPRRGTGARRSRKSKLPLLELACACLTARTYSRRRSAERSVKKSELAVGPLRRNKISFEPDVPRSPGSVKLGQEKGAEQSDQVIACKDAKSRVLRESGRYMSVSDWTFKHVSRHRGRLSFESDAVPPMESHSLPSRG